MKIGYVFIYIYIYIWVRLEIPYPHWEVCLGGMLRRYASGFASGVCFGVCFACTSSHGTYFISKRLPKIFPTFCISLCVSLQGCEVSYSRVQNVPGSGSWRFEVWNGCDSGMIRVWFAEHYSAHRIRSRQELQRPVSTRSWLMQTVSAATMKLERPVSTESCLQPTWLHRAARLRGWRAGWRKGRLKAAWSKCCDPSWYIWAQDLQITTINNPSKMIFIVGVCFGVCFGGMLRGMLRGYASQERHLPPIHI